MSSIHPKAYEVSVLSLNALQKIEKIAAESMAQMQDVILSIDKSNVISNSIKNVLIKQNKILEKIHEGIVIGNKKKEVKSIKAIDSNTHIHLKAYEVSILSLNVLQKIATDLSAGMQSFAGMQNVILSVDKSNMISTSIKDALNKIATDLSTGMQSFAGMQSIILSVDKSNMISTNIKNVLLNQNKILEKIYKDITVGNKKKEAKSIKAIDNNTPIHLKVYEVSILSLNTLNKIATDLSADMQSVILSVDKSNMISTSIKHALNKIATDLSAGIQSFASMQSVILSVDKSNMISTGIKNALNKIATDLSAGMQSFAGIQSVILSVDKSNMISTGIKDAIFNQYKILEKIHEGIVIGNKKKEVKSIKAIDNNTPIHLKAYEVLILSLNALNKIATDLSAGIQSFAGIQSVILSVDKSNMISTSIKDVLLNQNKILEEIRESIAVGNKKKEAKVYGIGNMSLEKIKNAAGLVGLLGFSILTLSIAYKMAGTISPSDIGKGLLVTLSLVPILKVFGELIQAKGKLFGDTMGVFRFMKSATMMVATIVTLGYMLSKLPAVNGGVLLTAVALAGVYYIIGTVYVKLIEAFRFGGIISFLVNRKTGAEAQHALIQTAFTLVVIAGAMRLAPTLNPSQAASFVIAAFTLVPLAIALVGLRMTAGFIKDVEYKDLLKMGVAITALGLALVPIAFAAKLVDKVGITPDQLTNLLNLTTALAPLIAMVGLITAVISFVTENNVSTRDKNVGSTLLQRDNSRKRNQSMTLKSIGIFAIRTVVVVGALMLAAVAFRAGAGIIQAGAVAARKIDMIGVLKMGLTLSIFTLIVGGFVNILRGRGGTSETSSTSAGKGGFLGDKSSSTSQGEIKKNDLIAAAFAIPIIALGIVAAAWIFKMLPSEQKAPDALWTLKAGFALLAFSLPFYIIAKSIRGMSKQDLIAMGLAIPILSIGILSTAWIWQLLPEVFKSPPLQWSINAGIAISLFAIGFYFVAKAIKGAKTKDLIFSALSISIIAISIVLISFIFQGLPDVYKSPPLKWVFESSFAIGVFGIGFYFVAKAIKGMNTKEMLLSVFAIPILATGILATAWIFQGLPDVFKSAPLKWILKAGLAIGVFGIASYYIIKAIKGMSTKEMLLMAFAIPILAAGILATAWIFQGLPDVFKSPDPIWVLKAGFAMLIFAIPFYFVAKAIKGMSTKEMLLSIFAIPILATGILATAWIFQGLPDVYKSPDLIWVFKAGLAIGVFGIASYFIMKAIKGMSTKEILLMAFAIPIIALGVLATAWIFQGLPDVYKSPESTWLLKSALAIVLFGAMIYLSSKTIGKLGMVDMLKSLLGVVITSFAILAVAWLFSMLPGLFVAPPLGWTLAIGVALGAFALVITAVGLAVSALTPATLLLGALGIIVIAITIVAVGWILSLLEPAMPALKSVANGFVDIVMSPIHGIIDAFARFKNEIGVENLIPLAVGVAALGGAWLIFSAAVAGGSVAGLLGSAAGAVGAIFDGISKLFNGKNPSPLDILQGLASLAPEIKNLAVPLKNVGVGFAQINSTSGGVSKAFKSVIDFSKIDNNKFASNAKSLRSIAGSYTGIANASKIMNIKAIESTTNMFKALTDLAKNKGESAMSVLADKLLKAVKELTGAAKNLEDSVKTQGSNTDASADLISKSLVGVKETVTGVKKDVSKMTADAKGVLDIQPLIDAIISLEDRFDDFITVKIKTD